jgi:hypothetical protein
MTLPYCPFVDLVARRIRARELEIAADIIGGYDELDVNATDKEVSQISLLFCNVENKKC